MVYGVSSDTVLVWASVTIGVGNWARERLHGQRDGRWESGILCAFMAGRAGGRDDGSDGKYLF